MEGADDRVINASGRVSEMVIRVAVVRPAAKLTGVLLMLLLKATDKAIQRQLNDGGVSLKKLNKSGQALDKKEVAPESMADLKRQLRKNGVEFSPQVDPLNPEKMYLYFKAKDHATLKYAFDKVVKNEEVKRQKKVLKTIKQRDKIRTKQPKNMIHLSKKKIASKGSLKR